MIEKTRQAMAEDRRYWHLDKTLNVSHLLTTIVIAGSLFAYAGGMDKRVTVLEEKMQNQVQANERVTQDMRDIANDLKFEIRALRAELKEVRPK